MQKIGLVLLAVSVALAAPPVPLKVEDLYKLRAVSDVQASRDGSRVAYSVQNSDRPGQPYSQTWIMELASRRSVRLGGDKEPASNPRWSPDGERIAYFGRDEDAASLMIAKADGSGAMLIAPVRGTNHPLPRAGERLAWSPDGKRIAFVSATSGPEQEANGDPMVITRYLYKPTASEGLTRFNDNRRMHIFVADLETRQVRQLTTGNYYEHSIAWSPRSDEILFVSNREPDPDRFFNYDLFVVGVADGNTRRLTETKNAEYYPRWSPDGRTVAYLATKRPLTSSETTMEDTHVWLMDADGRNRRELGRDIDNRQGAPEWTADGRGLFFTVQERGSNWLYRLTSEGGARTLVTPERGSVGSWSLAGSDRLVYAFMTPSRPAELYMKLISAPAGAQQLTNLGDELFRERQIADVEAFTFRSFDGLEVEAYITKPIGSEQRGPASAPLVVMIHGGPHGQQGPAFNSKAQIYAGAGYATLMVNYRGSTGYGQAFADAIFKDQNGGEARDVIAGVDAALARYPWLDGHRLGIEGGSYGGQLTNWIITRTDRFRAAIPAASISNLVSFNYMAYYHDYLAVEFGAFPHENGLIDLLWERSPIRYAGRVKTPTMFIHGENDNDVPIAEAEQFFIALKDVGVETIMVRYPREGHGIRETKHVADVIERSLAWYGKYLNRPAGSQEKGSREH